MDSKVIVATDKAPKAIGPYSQAVGYNGLLFCSGQIPIDPSSGEVIEGGIEAQTARVMGNLAAVLDARGLDFSHALRTTIYLKNMTDYAKVNAIYGRFFDRNPPARVAVEVSRLPKDVLVEIDMIAAVPEPAAAPTISEPMASEPAHSEPVAEGEPVSAPAQPTAPSEEA